MARFAVISLFLLAMLACNNPFYGQCACTAKACSEGVLVRLSGNPDTSVYRDFSVAIAYGDTLEAASPYWPSGPNDYSFGSGRLLRQRPSRIGIHIDYAQDGVPKSLALDSALDWTSFVCNQCSGDSPSCRDEKNYLAVVELDLGPRL
jgi:hypothetical protein